MPPFDASSPVVATITAEAAGSRTVAALAALLLAGLTAEQISRLADLRVRAQRGAYADDGCGTLFGSPQTDRRLAFARWLVRTGRVHDGCSSPIQ